MIKNLLIFLICTFFVSSAFAQAGNSKKMLKIETRIDFEYITFDDSAKQPWIKSPSKLNLQDFNKSLISALNVSQPRFLSVTENDKLNFKNGISQYNVSPRVGLVENFLGVETEFQYLSSESTKASVLFRLNNQKFQLDLSKDIVSLIPIGKNTFAAFHLVAVKKELDVCSLDEIAQEIINKNNRNWVKTCYDAGSPELTITE